MTLVPTAKARDDRRPVGASRPETGMRRYAREIIIVLIVKTIALAAIWEIWFSGPGRKGVSADRVAERLYPSNPPVTPPGGPHARP